MSFFLTDAGYRAPGLAALPGIEHSFGTRHAGPAGALRTLKQVHSSLVIDVSGCSETTEGDALVSAEPGVWLAVKTADCVPVLIVSADGRAVAAVHAGWRGTAAGIVTHTVDALTRRFGVRSEDLHAAIGPSIGPCCYEVGEEVAARFASGLLTGRHLDLWTANQRALQAAGVPSGQIELAGLCTFCLAGEFYSWRREGSRCGRMYSAVRLAPR